MTKTVSTSKKPRKQHSPEFRSEALKLAERIGVTAAARETALCCNCPGPDDAYTEGTG